MIRQLLKSYRKQVLVDINTQKDLFLADGKACVGNHRRLLQKIRRIMAWARYDHIPVISTCEVFPENNGHEHPPYCIDGTDGQKKISYTLLKDKTSFPADGSTDFPLDILHQNRQIILHNRTQDPFDEPRIERLLTEIDANEFILIGAPAEETVKAAALGLLQRGKKVTVIKDALGSLDKQEAELAVRKMMAKGAKLINTKNIVGSSNLKGIGICDCPLCSQKKHQATSC